MPMSLKRTSGTSRASTASASSAVATVIARARAVGLAEAIEHVRQEFRRYPLARVGHADLDVRFDLRRRDLHVPPLRRELDGVREQVPHDLLEPVGVAGEALVRQVRSPLEADAFGLGGWPHR